MQTTPLSLARWKARVSAARPNAVFVLEDGSGATLGDVGSWAALEGADAQADCVGAFMPGDFCWWEGEDGAVEAGAE